MAVQPQGQNVAQDGRNGGTDSDTINGQTEDVYFRADASGQPPPFVATGKGLNVTHPDFEATVTNANASLEQMDQVSPDPTRPWLGKIYLFVDAVRSSWQVQGSYGQTHLSRTYYPHSFQQGDWTIEGQMANQFEYDKLVEFVQHHQHHILTGESHYGNAPLQVPAVNFALFKPANLADSKFKHIPHNAPGPLPSAFEGPAATKIFLSVAITNIQAGHERFVFAPAFTITCKVLYDYWKDSNYVGFDIWQGFDPVAIFGDVITPHIVDPSSAGNDAGPNGNPPGILGPTGPDNPPPGIKGPNT